MIVSRVTLNFRTSTVKNASTRTCKIAISQNALDDAWYFADREGNWKKKFWCLEISHSDSLLISIHQWIKYSVSPTVKQEWRKGKVAERSNGIGNEPAIVVSSWGKVFSSSGQEKKHLYQIVLERCLELANTDYVCGWQYVNSTIAWIIQSAIFRGYMSACSNNNHKSLFVHGTFTV